MYGGVTCVGVPSCQFMLSVLPSSRALCHRMAPLAAAAGDGGGDVEQQEQEREEEEEEGFLADDDLVCKVLCCLPVPSLVRARSVCKKWNRLLTGKGFPGQGEEVQATARRWPWCLVCCPVAMHKDEEAMQHRVVECWAFDPQARRWYTMSFPELRPETDVTVLRSEAGASGLVVMRGLAGAAPCYWVGNPVTNKWQRVALSAGALPHGGGHDDKILHQLLVDEATQSYKLVRICQGASCFHWAAEVYHSGTREWRKGATMADDDLMLLPSSSTASAGVIYCLGLDCSPGGFANKRVVVLAYHVEQDSFAIAVPSSAVLPCLSLLQLNWFTLQVVVMPGTSRGQPSVIELVGRTDLPKAPDEPMPITERIFVVGYDRERRIWVGKADMKVSDCFAQEYCGYLNCSGGGHMLYITSSSSPFNGVVMYDRSKPDGWSSLPDHIRKTEEVLHRLLGTSASMGSFVPRLDVTP